MSGAAFRLANKLYEHAYPAYAPIYAVWKAIADRRERRLLRGLVRPGMTVVDVGANIGVYTRFLARLVGPTGRVHAFEPDQRNFNRLQAACRGLANVTVNHAAVAQSSGTLNLYLSDEMNVDHRTFDSGDGRAATPVRSLSLDDYFEPGVPVDFMKIDVQGYECSVLLGAERVLRQNGGLRLLMEFWPYGLTKAGRKPLELLEFAQACGFRVVVVGDANAGLPELAALDAGDLTQYCNLLLSKAPAR